MITTLYHMQICHRFLLCSQNNLKLNMHLDITIFAAKEAPYSTESDL